MVAEINAYRRKAGFAADSSDEKRPSDHCRSEGLWYSKLRFKIGLAEFPYQLTSQGRFNH